MTLKYNLKKGTLTITGCNPKPTGDLIIPDTIDGFPVTSIGERAFYRCTGLIDVAIPSGILSIGHQSFAHCTGLKSVTIPASVLSISGWAFLGCSGLKSLALPSSLTSIGYGAFFECNGLTAENLSANPKIASEVLSQARTGV